MQATFQARGSLKWRHSYTDMFLQLYVYGYFEVKTKMVKACFKACKKFFDFDISCEMENLLKFRELLGCVLYVKSVIWWEKHNTYQTFYLGR